ncbi:MAG TPA: polysaccharide deacetylase family protein [Polyangia bacterium]|nr:polysaccharide deacetylase family protein [Polyangia bacterium]
MNQAVRAIAVALIFESVAVAKTAPPRLGTVHEQVRRAKKELEAQPDQRSYRASPFSPTEIVERIHALESDAAWDGLCAELADLPDDELELFEGEIRQPDHARHLWCAATLLSRIAAHWRGAARAMAEQHALPATVTLPSVAVAVDVTKPHVFGDGELPAGEIALTFDDGPHATRTPRILAILAAAGIKATFFEIGRNAAAAPAVSRAVRAAGHTVGSHTFSHADLPKVTEAHAESEIEAGEAAVSLALGVQPRDLPFFRFPYGAKTPAEQAFVERRGASTFGWNMDSEDWRIRDPHKLFVNVLAQLDHRQGRGIILFHDIHEQTVIVLPHVLAELQARHLKAVVFVPSGERP